MEEEKKKSNKIMNFLFILTVLIVGVVLYARFVGTEGLIVKEYKIESENIPKSFSGFKIVHISDIYFGSTTDIKDIKTIVKRINELKPDLVVFTGNLIQKASTLTEKSKKSLIEELSKIESATHKYSIKGNDDYNENFVDIITSSGFTILENEIDYIYYEGTTPIFIAGLGSYNEHKIDLDKVFPKTIEEPDKKETTNYYKIVLINEGDATTEILSYDENVNLILAGNSLNGSVVVPFYGQLYIPNGSKRYFAPYYKVNNTDLYVSSGIGTDKIRFRLLNRPSFNFYRLKANN